MSLLTRLERLEEAFATRSCTCTRVHGHRWAVAMSPEAAAQAEAEFASCPARHAPDDPVLVVRIKDYPLHFARVDAERQAQAVDRA